MSSEIERLIRACDDVLIPHGVAWGDDITSLAVRAVLTALRELSEDFNINKGPWYYADDDPLYWWQAAIDHILAEPEG